MQETGWQGGPSATVDSTDFTPPGLQQTYTAFHNHSTSESPLLPPYARGPSPPPSYASSADDSSSGLWEDGAEEILRGNDLEAMRLVCRFRTYRDESLLREILRTRWPPSLNAFFVRLHADDWETVVELDVDRKVEEILKQLLPSVLLPDPLDIQPLHDLLHEADVLRTALELNKKSCSAFKKIAFPDWARAARDPNEYVDSVEDFFDWHGSLQDLLEDRLRKFPDERAKYIQMEKFLPEQSPARCTVSQSLRSHRPNADVIPQPGHEAFLCELQGFFKREHRNPFAAVRQLGVLEVRYQRIFLSEDEIDWTPYFWADVDFFEQITTTPTTEIADLLTELNVTELRLVPPQQFIDGKGHRLRHVHRRCNRLCEAVQESILFANQLGPRVTRLAKELRTRRNFNSLTPTLQALRETGFDESTLPDLFALINSDRNYSCYRKAYEEAPSVPFLPPHVRQLIHCQERGLSQIYAFLTYKYPGNLTTAQMLGKQEGSWTENAQGPSSIGPQLTAGDEENGDPLPSLEELLCDAGGAQEPQRTATIVDHRSERADGAVEHSTPNDCDDGPTLRPSRGDEREGTAGPGSVHPRVRVCEKIPCTV
ncbi:MAG: hypothetical protein Q9181_007494 [Wetmoreana brouardii]